MSKPVLHQISVGATVGDAITAQLFQIQGWLRGMGFESEIYAEHIHPALEDKVRAAINYRPRKGEQWVIYHHSIGSQIADRLVELPVEVILLYHNITPPEFFEGVNPAIVEQLKQGRRQLATLRARTPLALAVSSYNEEELRAVGFPRTGLLPLALDEASYNLPSSPELVERYSDTGPLLLFVGRKVPNKKPEDLLKLLYYYRRIEPRARLILVGEQWLPDYDRWLRDLARDLDMADGVIFTGHVTQQEMVSYYRLADLYVSMSEHEGFGKPLIESMYFDLPVLAYASTGVPYTMGEAGVLFHEKNYEALAELVDLMVTDSTLRSKIIAGQRLRLQQFLEAHVQQTLRDALSQFHIADARG